MRLQKYLRILLRREAGAGRRYIGWWRTQTATPASLVNIARTRQEGTLTYWREEILSIEESSAKSKVPKGWHLVDLK
jgi:hypothetical protein